MPVRREVAAGLLPWRAGPIRYVSWKTSGEQAPPPRGVYSRASNILVAKHTPLLPILNGLGAFVRKLSSQASYLQRRRPGALQSAREADSAPEAPELARRALTKRTVSRKPRLT